MTIADYKIQETSLKSPVIRVSSSNDCSRICCVLEKGFVVYIQADRATPKIFQMGSSPKISLSHDGALLLVGTKTGDLTLTDMEKRPIWSTNFGQPIHEVHITRQIQSIVALPGRLMVFDVRGSKKHEIALSGNVQNIISSDDGSYILVWDDRRNVYYIDSTKGLLWTTNFNEDIKGAYIPKGGIPVIVWTAEPRMFVYNSSGTIIANPRFSLPIITLKYNRNKDEVNLILSRELQIINLQSVQKLKKYIGKEITCGTISDNFEINACVLSHNELRILTGEEELWNNKFENEITHVNLSQNGDILLIILKNGDVHVYDNRKFLKSRIEKCDRIIDDFRKTGVSTIEIEPLLKRVKVHYENSEYHDAHIYLTGIEKVIQDLEKRMKAELIIGIYTPENIRAGEWIGTSLYIFNAGNVHIEDLRIEGTGNVQIKHDPITFIVKNEARRYILPLKIERTTDENNELIFKYWDFNGREYIIHVPLDIQIETQRVVYSKPRLIGQYGTVSRLNYIISENKFIDGQKYIKCPSCNRDVKIDWILCPHCSSSLRRW